MQLNYYKTVPKIGNFEGLQNGDIKILYYVIQYILYLMEIIILSYSI